MADSNMASENDGGVAIGAADTAMTDAPAVTPTAPTPSATTPAPARTTTPQRNGGAGLEPAFPTKAAPHGAQCRQYLNEKVTSALLAGMKKVAAEQPEDPLRMLGEYLLAKSRELEGKQ